MVRNVNSCNYSHNVEEGESVTVENNYLAECTLTINNNNNDESNILNEENTLTDLNNSESINMTTCKASSVGFDIQRISISHRKCCTCKKESYNKNSNKHHKLQLVSHFAILDAFKKTKILIPYGARCCRNHFKNDLINEDAIKLLVPYAQTYELNDNNIGSFKILFDALTDDAVTNDLFHKF